MLADADALLLAIIRGATAANVGTQVPDKFTKKLPFVVARRFGGAAVDPRFLDRATVSVDVWAEKRKDAYELAAVVRQALFDAAANQTVYPDLGHLSRFNEVTAPAELRTEDQPDNVWRFQATYSLFVRPATS